MLNEGVVHRRIVLLAAPRRRRARRRVRRISRCRCRRCCQAGAPGQRFSLRDDLVARRRGRREPTAQVPPSSCTKSVFLDVLRRPRSIVTPRALPSILGSDVRAPRGSVKSRPNAGTYPRSSYIARRYETAPRRRPRRRRPRCVRIPPRCPGPRTRARTLITPRGGRHWP